jgi:hypothetical protein
MVSLETPCISGAECAPIDFLTYGSHDLGFPTYLFPSIYIYLPRIRYRKKRCCLLVLYSFLTLHINDATLPPFIPSVLSPILQPLELPFLCRYITNVIYMCFL